MPPAADGPARLAALLAELHAEFPYFRVIRKDQAPSQRALGHLLRAATFGGQDRYVDGFHTTLGQRVYVTPDWDARAPDEQWAVLRHERVHLRQFRRYGWLGMGALYGACPLPFGLAWGRAALEKEAYAETMRAEADLWGVDHLADPATRARILQNFTGAAYGWMWPFPKALERWYGEVLSAIRNERAMPPP